MADARVIANRFFQLAQEDGGRTLTPMQLLKLVYIAHGWMLGLNDRPLIDQRVEAWQYGPVVRDVYNAVRQYGRSPVTAPLWAPQESVDPIEDHLVREVYQLYGRMDGLTLSNITHMPDTPWANTYTGAFGTQIPNELIAEHYRRLAKERTPQQVG